MDRSVYEARWILIVMLVLTTGLMSAGIGAGALASRETGREPAAAHAQNATGRLALAGDPVGRSGR
ncbi:hypothetical protein [Rhizobium sp. SSA_523]|uniref:hypothetical protein n=1 Tax=Rhizobium sp. SSA_523 TaxID=2952477 RepID=UPI002090A4C7|nr:hypothetical protein [Rhizobium sp. SSA_523]MCO5731353.1 hypothetical protein [Rhizobium sp. SSA_523]WKC22118.1 hypothetical protein QTJ18_02945 [Rhizobium sp. SSA_523]